MAFDPYPPSGLDRADGSVSVFGQPVGTPTPAGAMLRDGSTGGVSIFEEKSSSPSIERGEQATIVHTFSCDEVTATVLIQSIGRGQVYEDSGGDLTRVLSCRYDQRPGNMADITITAEGLNFDAPPDEFSVEVVEFNPALFLHPRYEPVISFNGATADGTPFTGPMLIGLINQIVSSQQPGAQTSSYNQLFAATAAGAGGDLAYAYGIELLQKMQKGVDTFYLAGFKVTWSYYYFLPTDLNPGGYIENPVTAGGLPYFFWSDNGTPTGNNIFTTLAASMGLATYPPFTDTDGTTQRISWLRLADTIQYSRTWFKVTRSWLGGPGGHWDEDIYNRATTTPDNVPTVTPP